jgi:hypothetical protein
MHCVVGGVEVEDDLLGSLGVRSDERIDENSAHARQGVAVDTVFQSAQRRR